MLEYAHNRTEFPHIIRPVTPDDIKIVARVDRDAFEAYRRSQRQLARTMRLRTPENMNAAIRRPHPGVVLEHPEGTVVGYCFTHVWGELGWLGTLGVAPRRQGFGFGRAVIAAGLDVLREAGCTTLALETMPENCKNLALYTRLGLPSRYMTLIFQGYPRPATETRFQVWQGGPEVRQISAQMMPGLDLTPAAQWLVDEDAGRTLVWWEDGVPVACVALRHNARRMQSAQDYLTVEVAACIPDAAARWERYLAELGAYAKRLGKRGLIFPVNARQDALVRLMLDLRMRIAYTRVRMASGAWIGAPDALLMLTLAM